MVSRKIRWLLPVLLWMAVPSCKKATLPPAAIDFSYFPLVQGKYIIYDVDSVGYWAFYDSVITSHYQIKESVDSPFIDASGNTAYRILRSRRKDENSPWITTEAWYANLTDHTAERVEENLRFIKLDLPAILYKQWYGNEKIQTTDNLAFLAGWEYEYTAVNQPFALNGYSFDSTLTVKQHVDSNVIQQYIYREVYAKGVGLIYKYEDSLSTQPQLPWNGRVVTMTLKEFN